MPLFHYSLNPGGVLFLGSAGTIGGGATGLPPHAARRGSSGARSPRCRRSPSNFPRRSACHDPTWRVRPSPKRRSVSRRSRISWSCSVTLRRGARQRQGRYPLHQRPHRQVPGTGRGKANWNLFAWPAKVRYELTSAFQKALRQPGRMTLHGPRSGPMRRAVVEVAVQRLDDPAPLQGW